MTTQRAAFQPRNCARSVNWYWRALLSRWFSRLVGGRLPNVDDRQPFEMDRQNFGMGGVHGRFLLPLQGPGRTGAVGAVRGSPLAVDSKSAAGDLVTRSGRAGSVSAGSSWLILLKYAVVSSC